MFLVLDSTLNTVLLVWAHSHELSREEHLLPLTCWVCCMHLTFFTAAKAHYSSSTCQPGTPDPFLQSFCLGSTELLQHVDIDFHEASVSLLLQLVMIPPNSSPFYMVPVCPLSEPHQLSKPVRLHWKGQVQWKWRLSLHFFTVRNMENCHGSDPACSWAPCSHSYSCLLPHSGMGRRIGVGVEGQKRKEGEKKKKTEPHELKSKV